jgi:hypothetical protein
VHIAYLDNHAPPLRSLYSTTDGADDTDKRSSNAFSIRAIRAIRG